MEEVCSSGRKVWKVGQVGRSCRSGRQVTYVMKSEVEEVMTT